MPSGKKVTRSAVDAALNRMGVNASAEETGIVRYTDTYGGPPLILDWSMGDLPLEDVCENLRANGHNPDVFAAHLEE